MKNKDKAVIRSLILDRLNCPNCLNRYTLFELAEQFDLHPFEVMEFYEEQIRRIDKMFHYPNQNEGND